MNNKTKEMKETNKSNKRNIKKYIGISLIIIIIAIIAIVSLWIYKKSNIVNGIDISNKRVLIEKSYQNYAWGYQYSGTVICEDGSIYSFKFEKPSDTKYDKKTKASKDILEHITESKGTVNKDDLKQLKEQLSTITNDVTEKHAAYDAGQTSIKYYHYDTNEIITLKSSGDYERQNNSQNLDNVLKILKKYDMEVTSMFGF